MMSDRDFWVQMRRGLQIMVVAIERRWNLPHSSVTPLNAAQLLNTDTHGSPPSGALTRSADEGIGNSNAIQ